MLRTQVPHPSLAFAAIGLRGESAFWHETTTMTRLNTRSIPSWNPEIDNRHDGRSGSSERYAGSKELAIYF